MPDDLLDLSAADPRHAQRRIAVTPSGRTVWVEITGDDRLTVIKRLPHRWPEVVMARERGESLDDLAVRFGKKVPPPCRPGCRMVKRSFPTVDAGTGLVVEQTEQVHEGPECISYHLAACYNFIEAELNDMAAARARLMV